MDGLRRGDGSWWSEWEVGRESILFGGAAAASGEEILEQGYRFFGANASGYFDAMIGAVVGEDFKAGANRAAFGFVGAVDEAGDAGLEHGSGAHRAGLDRHVKSRPEQAIVSHAECGFAKRENLGMGRGIAVGDGAVAGARDYLFIDDEDGADGNLAALGGIARFGERLMHEGKVAYRTKGHSGTG